MNKMGAPGERVDYKAYLRTEKWQGKRRAALRVAEGLCQICYGAEDLHVHHRTYDRLGNERTADLTVLCERCHGLFHKYGRLATPRNGPRAQRRPRGKRPKRDGRAASVGIVARYLQNATDKPNGYGPQRIAADTGLPITHVNGAISALSQRQMITRGSSRVGWRPLPKLRSFR